MHYFPVPLTIVGFIVSLVAPQCLILINVFRFQSMGKDSLRTAGGNSLELPETASSRLVVIVNVIHVVSFFPFYE